MISYAQNFEDVMLSRALKHVNQGFYIDVGANDPTLDSVTKVFYDRGWRGVNLEPLDIHHADLQKHRPGDINLKYAAGEHPGEVDLVECDVRGWGTADTTVAQQLAAAGHPVTVHRVPVITLKDVCQQYASSGDIHFLKIDVEGYERPVLAGMDFHKFRPWIVVVEATRPNSSEENHDTWEDLLLTSGYRSTYADGLNRFYVAHEHAELADAFKYPPNVFDRFITASQHRAEIAAAHAAARLREEMRRTQSAETQAQQLATELETVYASTSWRMTAPLRTLKHSLKERVIQILRAICAMGKPLVRRSAFLTRASKALLQRMPRLARLAVGPESTALSTGDRPKDFNDLGAIRIMDAMSHALTDQSPECITFLQVPHAR